MSSTHSVQLPPDGAGKKIRHERVNDVVVTEIQSPDVGGVVYGKISGLQGEIAGIVRTGTITYHIHMGTDTGEFADGEILWDGASVDYATITSSTGRVYQPSVALADADSPEYTVNVDKNGAASVVFSEGSPSFDAFGRTQVSQTTTIASYTHIQEDTPEKYWTDTTAGGSLTYDVNTSSVVYSTGTGNTDAVYRTTNQYHPYRPGVSHLAVFSLAIGDTGKSNLVREWGYFDDLNGAGFRLNGTTFEVFVRSDTTGSVVEEVITQADFNTNPLDDPIRSDFLLDVSKSNIYWIDLEWLGSGAVRFGTYTPDGRRLVMHTIENANSKNSVYMRTCTLPIRWGQKNIGPVGSTSEMRVACASVFSEAIDDFYAGKLIHYSPPAPIAVTNDTAYVPLVSFRPKLTINGKPNRIIGFHETFDWMSTGDPVHIAIFAKPAGYISDGTWSSSIQPNTMLEINITGTTTIPSTDVPIESFIASGNGISQRIYLGDRIEKSFGLPADGVTQDELIIAAKVLVPAGSGSVVYSKYWKEVP